MSNVLVHRAVAKYSASGACSTDALRRAYPTQVKKLHDPAITNYFFEHMVALWFRQAPSYHYWIASTFMMGAAFGVGARHIFFNPDVYVRKQEAKKPPPDRHRQWTYSLPYFNHRLRNFASCYRHSFIDNEPDWVDNHPLGYRVNRVQMHKKVPGWSFGVYDYVCEDPLYTSITFENMTKIYEGVGYTKPPRNRYTCEGGTPIV
mmetsp:Transcript_25384/g.55833  ORF Transcript_25384/g.55833 Transcript_25384/m.55833 type:complete len:204 (-) Transcript_25384:68-679(-)